MLRIKMRSSALPLSSLSGGNQQKVVLCKWLATEAEIFILDEPTRGIDVGAKREIYEIIDKLRKQNKAIIMISSEMLEILGMCDRIVVLHEGRLMGELDREDATQEKILQFASGAVNQ
jgi:ABC-type sugar transport system ATPase subunit